MAELYSAWSVVVEESCERRCGKLRYSVSAMVPTGAFAESAQFDAILRQCGCPTIAVAYGRHVAYAVVTTDSATATAAESQKLLLHDDGRRCHGGD